MNSLCTPHHPKKAEVVKTPTPHKANIEGYFWVPTPWLAASFPKKMGANQWHGTDYSILYLVSEFRSNPAGHSSNDASTEAIVSPSFFLAFVLFIMYFQLLSVLLFSSRFNSFVLGPWSREQRGFYPPQRGGCGINTD